MNAKWKLDSKKIIQILLIAAICIIAVIALVGAGYTYPCEDDFSFDAGAVDLIEKYGSALNGAWRATWGFARSNQGTYLFNFLIHFLLPFVRWGLPGFHVFMIFFTLFYVFSLRFALKGINWGNNARLFFMLVVLLITFCLCGTQNNKELFFWYTGAMNYTLEISFSFISLGCFFRAVNGDDRKRLLVFGAITGLLASWGNLEISGINCAFLLLGLALNIDAFKKTKKLVIPFVFAFLGAVTNLAAPGNFIRADESINEGHSKVSDALRDLISCFKMENKVIFKSPIFLLILVVTFIVVIFCKEKIFEQNISFVNLLILVVVDVLIQMLVMFPVLLGNRASTLSSMRTAGSFEITARLLYVLLVICFAIFVKQYGRVQTFIALGGMVALALVAFICIDEKNCDWENAQVQCTIQDLHSGNLVKNYQVREYVLNACQMAEPGSDVVLWVPLYNTKSTYGMGITENPEWFVNVSVAQYYDLHIVAVFYEPEE